MPATTGRRWQRPSTRSSRRLPLAWVRARWLQLVGGPHVDARQVEYRIGLHFVEQAGQGGRQEPEVCGSVGAVGQSQVQVRRFFAGGVVAGAVHEKVNTRGPARIMAAVPLPWCTSRSTMSTCRTAGPCASSQMAAAWPSSRQNPLPRARNVWCVPPAMLKVTPRTKARRAPSIVPPRMVASRSNSVADHGKPVFHSPYRVSWPRRRAIVAALMAAGAAAPNPARSPAFSGSCLT